MIRYTILADDGYHALLDVFPSKLNILRRLYKIPQLHTLLLLEGSMKRLLNPVFNTYFGTEIPKHQPGAPCRLVFVFAENAIAGAPWYSRLIFFGSITLPAVNSCTLRRVACIEGFHSLFTSERIDATPGYLVGL